VSNKHIFVLFKYMCPINMAFSNLLISFSFENAAKCKHRELRTAFPRMQCNFTFLPSVNQALALQFLHNREEERSERQRNILEDMCKNIHESYLL